MHRIALVVTDEDILRCFPVMHELRPHLVAGDFVARVRRQEREGGFQMAFLEAQGSVKSVAGFRFLENFAWGRFLYVDDLVTRANCQSQGWGRALFDWLVAEARRRGCDQVHLDSGVQRFGAHRFYLAHGMNITCHHFARTLP